MFVGDCADAAAAKSGVPQAAIREAMTRPWAVRSDPLLLELVAEHLDRSSKGSLTPNVLNCLRDLSPFHAAGTMLNQTRKARSVLK